MLLFLWIPLFFAATAAYQDLDDNNYVKILSDKTNIENFFKCLIDQAPCDDFGNRIKIHITEFFADGCEECDAKQKHYSHLLLMILENDYPELFKVVDRKYDLTSNVKNVDEKLKKF